MFFIILIAVLVVALVCFEALTWVNAPVEYRKEMVLNDLGVVGISLVIGTLAGLLLSIS